MDDLLRATDLHRHFRLADTVVRAVDGIDLEVGEGEFLSVMGPSGCGKSTLLYLLAGLDRATGGEIRFGGRRVDRLSRTKWARLRRRHIGFVFQSFNLVENLTVLQNLEVQGILGQHSGRSARRRAVQLLDELGLGDKAKALPALLSGGQRQRVALARALMNDPPLLLADEPTGNLDSATTIDVLKLLRRFHTSGQTIVVVTHDERVATAAQRVLTMRDGRVVDETRLDGGTRPPLAVGDLVERRA
jgi:putative ABC transport system ATP-binding protein